MTPEEVLKELRDVAIRYRGFATPTFEVRISDMAMKAVDTIHLLLERERPLLIVVRNRGAGHCPVCDTDIHGIGRINYCFRCGQRLMWPGEGS